MQKKGRREKGAETPSRWSWVLLAGLIYSAGCHSAMGKRVVCITTRVYQCVISCRGSSIGSGAQAARAGSLCRQRACTCQSEKGFFGSCGVRMSQTGKNHLNLSPSLCFFTLAMDDSAEIPALALDTLVFG